MSVTTLIVGCGYLGERVATVLRRRGERVLGTVRSPSRADALRSKGIEPVVADVLDPDSLDALPNADRALYCVGFDRSAGVSMRSVYIDGLKHAAGRLVGKVGQLVYASSTGVYGPCHGDWIDEDTPTNPAHEAGRVVLDAEGVLTDLSSHSDLRAVILRFAGLYGPGRILHRTRLVRGEPIGGDPQRPLNLIHIDDAAKATVAALDSGRPGRIYILADDRPMPRREYYTLAARLLSAPEPRFVPHQSGSPEALREESSKRVRNTRMREELGVNLDYPDITKGLPAAISACH